MLIDTHIHLYAEEFDADRDLLIRLAHDSGIQKFLLPNIDLSSREGIFALCKQYPNICYPMMGLHPCYVKEDFRNQLDGLYKTINEHKSEIIAIGEIGLDYHWDVTFRDHQEVAFREQATIAAEMNLPIVIHSRESTDAIIAILKDMNLENSTGVFHCFSGTLHQANVITDMGYMLGIGGVVTFKNSGLDKIVAEISTDHIVLETDGPYLAPAPFRGKRNEPAYLRMIAEKVADIKQLPYETIANATTQNAAALFKIKL